MAEDLQYGICSMALVAAVGGVLFAMGCYGQVLALVVAGLTLFAGGAGQAVIIAWPGESNYYGPFYDNAR